MGDTFTYDVQDDSPDKDFSPMKLKEKGMPPGNPGFSSLPGRDQMDPSSAKVIPPSQGQTIREQSTYTASAKRVASKFARRQPVPGPAAGRGEGKPISEILGNTQDEIKQKAAGVPLEPLRFDPDSGFWSWAATGSQGQTYTVRLKGWGRKFEGEKDLGTHPVRCSCTCPAWRWQGPEHWAKVNGYLYRSFRNEPQGSMSNPVIRDPAGDHWVCKHVAAALQQARKWKFSSGLNFSLHDRLIQFDCQPEPARVAMRFAGLQDLKAREKVRVYHGSRLAYVFELINGFDANKVHRRYYGGPRHAGLFVTPSLQTALDFSDRGRFVLEIETLARNLHGVDYSGNIGGEYENELWQDKYPDSFRPYLSQTLLQSHEPQALLRGLVKPSQIKRVWYAPVGEKGRWYSRKEFLELGLQQTRARDQPYGRPQEVRDVGWDLSYPHYSLKEFLQATADALEVSLDRVEKTLRRVWGNGQEGRVEDLLDRAGFGPTAIRGFYQKMERAWGPLG